MSLAFQNTDTIKQALYEELTNILNPDTQIRIAAEGRLKQLEFTEGYGVFLAEFIMNQSFELALRQLASVMLKQYIEQHWCADESGDSTNVIATEHAKKMIKNILPNGLYDPNSKIRTVVAYTISTIASWDWPENWTELFDIIVKCLGGNENSVHGAMQVLVEFTYDLNHQITDVGPIIISEVYRIFEAEQIYTVKTRSCAVEIFKSLLKSINTHVQSKHEQQAMLNPVLPNFIRKLIHGLGVEHGQLSNFTLKTEIVKVLSYMVNEMPRAIYPYMNEILPPIWQHLTQTADIYLKVIVNESIDSPFLMSDEDDESESFTLMILKIFEFIHSIVESGKFRSSIKNVLTDLVYIIVVYMQISENQSEMWLDDPEKFVEDEDEVGVDFSVRVSGQDVLLVIGQEFEGKLLPALSNALNRHASVADAEKNAGNQHWWKIHEASMMAVGSFSQLILSKKDEFNLSEYLNLVQSLMDCQVSPYLSGRCIWLLSRFVESDLFNTQMLDQCLEVTRNSVAQSDSIILRILSIRAIYGICDNMKAVSDERHALVISKLDSFLDGILNVVQHCKSSVLGLLLEALMTLISFDEGFTASVQSKIIPLTIAIFLKYHDDPFILELVQDMLKALSQNEYCLQPLQERIVPTLTSMLNLQGEQANSLIQEIALDVLQTIVKYSKPPLSDNLIENAFPAAVHCILRSDDNSVMQAGGECMRAYITVSPEQVCRFKNGEGLNYIMQITSMLLNPMNTECSATFIGRLVITIITKCGNMLGEHIDMLLKAVISKMQLVESLHVIMSLVVTFAHLFLTQMDAVLHFLSTVPGPTGEPAMTFVFVNWLSRQHLFYGSYERKISTLALCKIFEYGVTSQDTRLTSVVIKELASSDLKKVRTRQEAAALKVQQQWVSIPIMVKIFKLLINELVSLREARTDTGENEDWTDEDSDHETESSPQKYTSDLIFQDDEDEEEEDDELTKDIMADMVFQGTMEENLMKFLLNFCHNEHFNVFFEHLSDDEKSLLQTIQRT